mgnify:FL=1
MTEIILAALAALAAAAIAGWYGRRLGLAAGYAAGYDEGRAKGLLEGAGAVSINGKAIGGGGEPVEPV